MTRNQILSFAILMACGCTPLKTPPPAEAEPSIELPRLLKQISLYEGKLEGIEVGSATWQNQEQQEQTSDQVRKLKGDLKENFYAITSFKDVFDVSPESFDRDSYRHQRTKAQELFQKIDTFVETKTFRNAQATPKENL